MRLTVPVLTLVLLAGCLGGISSTSPLGSPNTAWTNGDSVNTTALAERHFRELRGAGNFTTNHSETNRVDGEAQLSGPRPEGYHPPTFAREQVDLDEGRYLGTAVTVGHRRSNHFITPEVTARRHKKCPDCAYEYSYEQRPEGDTLSKRIDRFRTGETVTQLGRFLQGVTVGFNYSYAGAVKRDGETLYRYRAEQSLETAPPPFSAPPKGTATVLVTEEGVIRRFELQYAGPATVTVDGQKRTVTVTHTFVRTYTDVGETSIERPAWVNRASDSLDTQERPWFHSSTSPRRL